MARKSSFGSCELCGVRKGKAAMTAHLRQCLPAAAKGRSAEPMVLLRVQSRHSPDFWLHVLAGKEATLRQLDGLLRNVWLECCGHLSEFYDGGRDKIGMNTSMTRVFEAVGDRIDYTYDFGSSTELDVRFEGLAEGTFRKPAVIARNEPLMWTCSECEAVAATICSACEGDGAGFFCLNHAQDHECGEEVLMPIVNSPRMGVCGYTG